MPVPSQPSNAAQALTSNAQYGHAWMLAAVKEHQELDHALVSPCAKLQAYLESPLELTDDVVGWWGVCFSFLIQFNLLINEMYRNIKLSI